MRVRRNLGRPAPRPYTKRCIDCSPNMTTIQIKGNTVKESGEKGAVERRGNMTNFEHHRVTELEERNPMEKKKGIWKW